MANRFISGRVREIVYSPTFKIDLNQRRPRVLPISEKTGKSLGLKFYVMGYPIQKRTWSKLQPLT